jgi:selenoprotein W-related protein
MPYERFIAERIFQPLGMADSSFRPGPAKASRMPPCARTTPGGGDMADEINAFLAMAERRSSADPGMLQSSASMAVKHPRVEIEYCTQCRWLLRAAWMAQELLTTFQDEIGEMVLRPGTGGVFEVRVDDATVWSRAEQGRFPEMKEIKQLVRDRIAPDRALGHSDR